MTDPSTDPDARSKRGRTEMRLVFLLVGIVVLLGALYVAVFGSPNAENRLRDSPDYIPPGTPGGGPGDR